MRYRRLPLEGLYNARDLGGYPLPGGGMTAFGRFIRCEAPRCLTPCDLEFLRSYGVTLSIDFRGDTETERHPSSFESVDWATYRRCPTFDAQIAFASGGAGGRPSVDAFVDWGEKYIELVENGRGWLRDTFRTMVSKEGAVIFNCTTGKDRTGVVSALLLGLAGVSEPDIIADYCVSEIYLTDIYTELLAEYLKKWPEEKAQLDNPFFKTEPKNMAALLGHLREKYGETAAYVKSCGVGDEEISRLRAKLTAVSDTAR